MKKLFRNGFMIMIAMALLCGSFSFGSIGSVNAEAVEFLPFSIIMTAGMRGNVMPFEYQGQPDYGGYAKASTKVAEIRKELWMDRTWWKNGGETMTVDIGNAVMGSQTGWFFTNKSPNNDVHPTIKAMNSIGEIALPAGDEYPGKTVKGYDVMLYGASELSIQPNRRDQISASATFPWVASNITAGKDRVKFEGSEEWVMKVYKIPTAAHPLRFGVVGLTNPAVANWEDPQNLKYKSMDLRFEDYVEKAREWSEILKETGEKADFILVITDVGLEKNADGTWNQNNLVYKMIQEVSYIDFIISSSPGNPIQSESFVTQPEGGKKHETLVCQLPEDGITMGRMDLVLEKCTCPVKPYVFRMENGRRVMKARFITLDGNVAADQKIRNDFKASESLMNADFAKRAGESACDITSSNARYVDNPIAEVACKAMMKETGYEIALTDIWTTTSKIKKGSFTTGELFNMFPKDSKVYKLKLTGKQIKDALIRAAQVYRTTSDNNFIIAKGFTYSLDVRPGATNPVPNISLDMDKTYNVVTNSYIAFGQGGYVFPKTPKPETTNRKLLDIVTKYIKDNGGRLECAASKNWYVVPDYLDHWAKDYIQVLMDKKIVAGDKNGKYNPDANMVRAEAAKMVLTIYDHGQTKPAKGTFTDLPANNWAYPFVEGGASKGMWFWLKGKFEPNKNVTREEVFVNMVISMGKKAEAEAVTDADIAKFTSTFMDAGSSSAWAKKYLVYATQNGLVGGSLKNGQLYLSPTANIKRSEVAVVLSKARFPVVAALGTADFRSEVDQWRTSFDDKPIGGIAGLAYTIGTIRSSYDNSVLIDAGGMLSGTAYAELGNGKLATGLYSALGYDVAALSTKDFYLGGDKLKTRVADISCPVVASNIEGLDKSVKSTTLTINGIKVGIVGLVDPQVAELVCSDDLGQIKLKDTTIDKVAANINAEAASLKSKGAEIVILAGGIQGYIEMGMIAKQGFKGPAAQLASKLSGISAMFVSGSPMSFVAPASNGIQVIAPGVGGTSVGLAKIRFDTKTRSIDSVTAGLETAYAKPLTVKTTAQDLYNKVNSFVSGQKSAMKSEIEKVVGRTENGLAHNQNNESLLGDFITDYIKEETNADIVVFPSEIGWKGIGKGNITANDIYNAIPYEFSWYKAEFKGSKLRDIAENSVDGENSVLQIAGFMFIFTRSAEVGNRVVDINLVAGDQKVSIDDEKTYTIALPSQDLFALSVYGRELFKTVAANPKNACIYVRASLLSRISKLTEAGQPADAKFGNPVDQKGRFEE
ncbi:MAG: 5'-nucleotidase C-terminal domain-containing protein [Caldisericia bacterium]|nr:5'-nucleotidase C-terminal domain-containing protein [Caldisericia bacterium]